MLNAKMKMKWVQMWRSDRRMAESYPKSNKKNIKIKN
jgi:hypothetical protein